MKNGMRNKWIIAGLLWCAVVLLTLYNASEIRRLQLAWDETETLRMDEKFWLQHSEGISGLMAECNRLYLTIDSLDLGLLTIDNRLKTISAELRLPPVTLTKQQGNESDSQVPVGISFAGSLRNAIKLLKSLKKEMPFLKAKKLRITVDPLTHKAVLDASFILRYRTGPSIGEPETSGGT